MHTLTIMGDADLGPNLERLLQTRDVDPSVQLRQRLARWAGADAKIDDLDGLVVSELAKAAAASRMRARALLQQAVEGASFVGVLLDAAERGLRVELRLVSGRAVRGDIAVVGSDFCALRSAASFAHYVATGAIVQIRVEARALVATGDREQGSERTLEQIVREMSGRRERVSIVVAGSAEALSGELRSCGLDVCTLGLDLTSGTGRRWPDHTMAGDFAAGEAECRIAHLRLAAIDEVITQDV